MEPSTRWGLAPAICTSPLPQTAPISSIRAQVADLQPGLKVRFSPATGGSATHDARTLRLPAWHVPQGTSPAAFLPAGPFMAVAEGYLRAEMKGNYRFSLAGHGTATLVINDATIFADQKLSATGDTSADVLLAKGHNRLQLTYASPPAGDATLRLLWSGAQFEPELLPATALSHDGADPELLRRSPTARWPRPFCRASLRKLSRPARQSDRRFDARACGRCAARLSASAAGCARPGSRPGCSIPQSLCDDATMPRVLHDRPGLTSRQQAADIAAYLQSLEKPAAGTQAASPTTRRSRKVKSLYEDLGCIQCHRFTSPSDVDPFARTSL